MHRKKNLETNVILWQTRELELDMYDDPRLNRVYVNEQHTLTIKDMQPSNSRFAPIV